MNEHDITQNNLPEPLREPEIKNDIKPFWARNGWSIAFIFLLALLILPWLAWWQRSERPLRVTVLDKTVADRSFREHKGLFWILEHERITKPDGSKYNMERDYIGFEPLGDRKWQLREGTLDAPTDLVYVTDTYGVYEEEFYGSNKGNRTPLIYGGLQVDEVARLKKSLAGGGTFIAEFNSFASPTGAVARKALCDWLGIRWSGWMGRHFVELKRDLEVPPWAIRNYEKQYGRTYAFTGPGFLFCNDNDEVIVLEETKAVGPNRCQITFREPAKKILTVEGTFPYSYWFDISSPEVNTQVLADYHLDLKAEGVEALRKYGIPLDFPAIFYRREQSNDLYYFAGDFVDHPRYPWLVRYRGLVSLKGFFSSLPEERFYWGAYVPMMQTLLERAHHN